MWVDRRDSNSQLPEPQSGALPLSYCQHNYGASSRNRTNILRLEISGITIIRYSQGIVHLINLPAKWVANPLSQEIANSFRHQQPSPP